MFFTYLRRELRGGYGSRVSSRSAWPWALGW